MKVDKAKFIKLLKKSLKEKKKVSLGLFTPTQSDVTDEISRLPAFQYLKKRMD